MQLGMVGLGRMGANLVRRLVRDGHTCVVYDVSAEAVSSLAAEHDAITGATTLDEFVAALDTPKVAWVMVPAAFAGQTVEELAGAHEPGRHRDRRGQHLLPRRHRPGRGPGSDGQSTTWTSAPAAACSAWNVASAS